MRHAMAAAQYWAAVFFLGQSLDMKKTPHHEGHGDHEDLPSDGMPLIARMQSRRHLQSNLVFFFAAFVFFVVPILF
jgi:hypothetical protein